MIPTGTQDNRKDDRVSLPKSDLIGLDNFDRNSFYISEKGLESFSCSPNNNYEPKTTSNI